MSELDFVRRGQDLKAYRALNWEGSFADYLRLLKEDPRPLRTSFQRVHDMILAHGVEVRPLEEASFREGEVVVDALFGTGLKGPLTDFYAELVERVNRAGLPVLALDLPSGLPFSPHVRATATVAFAALKTPHLFQREACGKLYLAEIGLPKPLLEREDLPEVASPEALRPLLPRRPLTAHKGSVGRVGVLGGYQGEDLRYAGAPLLAALGAEIGRASCRERVCLYV